MSLEPTEYPNLFQGSYWESAAYDILIKCLDSIIFSLKCDSE